MKLSLITINLNHANGLKQTIESVLCQCFKDYEFIVIDGGSTDNSIEVINQYADRITYWTSEPDAGIYNAMNKGLRSAQGEYVCFLNSGDRLYSPGTLTSIFSDNLHTEDLLYGDAARTDGPKGARIVQQPEKLSVARFFNIGICHQASFYKQELFDALGFYDETLKIAADWDFNLRVLLARRSTRHLPFPVVHYEGSGISVAQSDLSSREKEIILTRHLPEAVYQDYLRLQFLEKECGRLKQFEDWTEQIRNRNVWANIAMVLCWFLRKLKRNVAG